MLFLSSQQFQHWSTPDAQGLIFDVDGTLAETEEAHRAAFNPAFKESELRWNWSVEDYRELLKTTGGKERFRTFLDWHEASEATIDTDDIPSLHALKRRHYVEGL